MAVIQPKTLAGMMELLPARQMQMERMMDILRQTYALYGFAPLDTPILESADILLAKSGGETEKQIYRFTRGENDLAMRFDLTVPLAKYVALHYNDLSFPFRRFQIGKVYRGERTQRGRFREFYQADIDIIGDGKLDIINEAEIPSVIYRTFQTLGLKRFCIRLNNRKLLNGFFEMAGVGEKNTEVLRVIDKWDKIGAENVQQLLLEECGLSKQCAEKIIAFLENNGDAARVAKALDELSGQNALFDQGAEELKTVIRYMEQFGVPAQAYTVDLTIARGLDYYTGTVYETLMLDHPEIGSICSGGRYDNLAAYYTDKPLPGVGISIGLTRLFYVLSEQGYLNDDANTAPADVMILPMTDDLSHAISLATRLRDAKIRTQLYTEQKKFKAKITYADKLHIPYVIFLGEDEIASGNITVKKLATGEQKTFSPEELIKALKEVMTAKAALPPICETEKDKQTDATGGQA